jgi:hypothetical protein
VPGLVGVASSAGDSKQVRLEGGLVTRRELLVVRWLAVEGLICSPGKSNHLGKRQRERKAGANFFKMTLIAEVGGLELDLFECRQWKRELDARRERITVKARLIVFPWLGALNNRIWLEVGTNSIGLCQSRLQSNN